MADGADHVPSNLLAMTKPVPSLYERTTPALATVRIAKPLAPFRTARGIVRSEFNLEICKKPNQKVNETNTHKNCLHKQHITSHHITRDLGVTSERIARLVYLVLHGQTKREIKPPSRTSPVHHVVLRGLRSVADAVDQNALKFKVGILIN
jgi:hypothetical protein